MRKAICFAFWLSSTGMAFAQPSPSAEAALPMLPMVRFESAALELLLDGLGPIKIGNWIATRLEVCDIDPSGATVLAAGGTTAQVAPAAPRPDILACDASLQSIQSSFATLNEVTEPAVKRLKVSWRPWELIISVTEESSAPPEAVFPREVATLTSGNFDIKFNEQEVKYSVAFVFGPGVVFAIVGPASDLGLFSWSNLSSDLLVARVGSPPAPANSRLSLPLPFINSMMSRYFNATVLPIASHDGRAITASSLTITKEGGSAVLRGRVSMEGSGSFSLEVPMETGELKIQEVKVTPALENCAQLDIQCAARNAATQVVTQAIQVVVGSVTRGLPFRPFSLENRFPIEGGTRVLSGVTLGGRLNNELLEFDTFLQLERAQ